jgi:hypothetical protein
MMGSGLDNDMPLAGASKDVKVEKVGDCRSHDHDHVESDSSEQSEKGLGRSTTQRRAISSAYVEKSSVGVWWPKLFLVHILRSRGACI